MNTTAKLLAITLLPLLTGLSARSAAAQDNPAAGQDIVATAAADDRFSVLASALEHAGLLDALRGDGPFTVFAPTDKAFAALPEGVVASLLAPERKADLQRILKAHVVVGRVLAADLVSTPRVKTLANAVFPVSVKIGTATVTQADIACSNGVIHVIDSVLIPAPEEKPMSASAVIHAAIKKGVPLYNAGHVEACATIYQSAAERLVEAYASKLSDLARVDMRRTLLTAPSDASERAWALREAFDRALDDMAFEPRLEASLPEGFPKPGPVGTVVKKRYPRYRAARAAGGASAPAGASWPTWMVLRPPRDGPSTSR